MKKLIKTAAIVMTLALTVSITAFAKPADNANGQIMNAFHQDFKNAELISTKVSKTFSKLTFKQDNTIMCAFYSNSDGELMALTRDIQVAQLPLNLLQGLKKYEAKGKITEAFEMKSDDQDSYYVTVETDEKKIVLHSNGSEWQTFSSTKK